jgi:hypothetical protein
MKSYSLKQAVRNGDTLTPDQQHALLILLGTRCRADTKERLRRRLSMPLSLWSEHGIYSRVYLSYDKEGVHYCAGQDYPSEIRTVRKCVLDN